MESMTGNGDDTNATSLMARSTSASRTLEVRAWTCVTIGSPSAPSQISTSIHRQPSRSTRRYMSEDAREWQRGWEKSPGLAVSALASMAELASQRRSWRKSESVMLSSGTFWAVDEVGPEPASAP
eukprot:scaffold6705_cov31-Tisochrysis_lutea.AAC.3